MKISSYGGVIAAVNGQTAFPLQKIGDTTAVKRAVLSFAQAGAFPIVIISGAEEDAVRYQLSSSGVVFLRLGQATPAEMFDAVKAGFGFLENICEKVIFTPVNAPLISPTTLRALMQAEGQIISPSYRGRSGHPVVVSAEAIPEILAYNGENGLRGALGALREHRTWVNVEDDSVLYTVHHGDIPAERQRQHDEELLHLAPELSLQKEKTIFDARAKLLLLLILKNQSVRVACEQMALSYSKAWDLLNTLERSLSVKLVERTHGGAKGGKTTLTDKGLLFLREYQKLEEDAFRYAQERFDTLKATLLP